MTALAKFLTFDSRRLQDFVLLGLRLAFGLAMFFAHGLPKLLGGRQLWSTFPDPLGLGSPASLGLTVFSEVLCSLAVVLGLLTRLATIPLIVSLMIALLVIHRYDPWARAELAFAYLIPFVVIFLAGPGRLSVDAVLFESGPRRAPL